MKRTGEAFIAIQLAKNALSDSLDEIARVIESVENKTSAVYLAAAERQEHFKQDYEVAALLAAGFEQLMLQVERGGEIDVDSGVIEAKIARANQLKVLAEFDSRYLQSDAFKVRLLL